MPKDLKVIELASVLAGPAAGMFFAELGAEVIKIENKRSGGDPTRKWKLPNEPAEAEISAYYCCVNWHKTVLFLDLTDQTDRETAYGLIRDADIVISNYKHGDDIKLGMDYPTLKRINPMLIYGQITGFGNEDKRPAYDIVLQAESGMMSMTGTQESGPVKIPIALIDIIAAHQLKEGILVSLLRRGKTGKGSLVSVSLLESAISSLANQATNWLMARHVPERMGAIHPNIAPYGEIFKTKDQKEVVLAIGTDKQFHDFCAILERPDISSDQLFNNNMNRVSNRKLLQEKIAPAIGKLEMNTLMNGCLSRKVPVASIKNIAEIFETETARNMILEENMNGYETKRVKTIAFKIIHDPILIKEPQTKDEFDQYYQLRWEVLRKPWDKARGTEKDEQEAECIHVMAVDENDRCIGVCRLQLLSSTQGQIRYMAVDQAVQGTGTGSMILKYVENRAKNAGLNEIMLHARENALEFYQANGYEVSEKSYLLWNEIQHYKMAKILI